MLSHQSIPFFKTLKEHFEGIQKALTKEIKEMKEIFEELEAEVDQNLVNRKYDEIELKNLLIANDNLIADCLSKEVFYIATNSELTIQKDDHNELVKRFSNLEVNHLNLQLKYQHLKESFGNNTSPPARDAPDFDSVFVIEKMKASIQGKDNAIKKLRMQISQLKETRSEADRTLDFRALDFQITQLTEKIIVLQEQNEPFRAKNAKIKQHYKELYDSIKITHSVKPRVLAPGRYAIDVEPIPPRNRNNREVHLDYLKHLRESVETLREIVEEAKFIEIVRSRNNHFGAIMGYGDYVIGDSVISRVYYVEGLGHNLFPVGQFCDSDLEVAFRKHSCYVRDTSGVELIKGSRGSNFYTISVEDMMKSYLVVQSLQEQIMVMTSSFKPLELRYNQ
ncbi:hypothetical protein Tco_1313463 [Tanacetum coccineum]